MLPAHVEVAFRQLIGALAGPEPLPAGGSAGVASLAMGVGLGIKVTHLSSPDPTVFAPIRERLEEILARLLPEFTGDSLAFAMVLEALRRPRDDAARAAEIHRAWSEAAQAPIGVALLAREAAAVLTACRADVKKSIRGDLDAALELVRAGGRIAENNARENAQHLDPAAAGRLLAPLDRDPA